MNEYTAANTPMTNLAEIEEALPPSRNPNRASLNSAAVDDGFSPASANGCHVHRSEEAVRRHSGGGNSSQALHSNRGMFLMQIAAAAASRLPNNNTNHTSNTPATSPTGNRTDDLSPRGLPLTVTQKKHQASEPRLLHPILRKIPMHLRFGFIGLVSNVIFMLAYNAAVYQLQHHKIASSTIYSIVYFFYIPLAHALVSLLVFGWPDRYVPSLMSNFPIGLTAIALGGGMTAWLDKIGFEESINEFIRNNFTFSKMPPRTPEDAPSEFFSSMVVLAVTSVWTYVLSVYVNSPPKKSDKKEL